MARHCTGVLCVLLLAAVAQATTHTGRAAEARGRLLVDVYLDGRGPYPFLLDAALKRPVIDTRLAADLHLPIAQDPAMGETPGGAAITAPVAYIHQFQVAPGLENDETVAVMDLAAATARLGRPVAGLLPAYQAGLEITLQFDPPGVTWRTLDEAVMQEGGDDAIPIKIGASGAPEFEVLLDGRYVRTLQLDLSLGGDLALSEDTLADLGDDPARTVLTTRLSTGEVERQVRLKSLKVGKAELLQPIAAIQGANGGDRVGLGFLKRHGVTLSYEFGRMYLAVTQPRFSAPPLAGYGLTLEGVIDGYWVLGVAAGSPAEQAGIVPGDRLLSVEGRRLYQAGYANVAGLLEATEGQVIALTVLQHGEPAPFTLTAAPLL
jgi:hypothetical protein